MNYGRGKYKKIQNEKHIFIFLVDVINYALEKTSCKDQYFLLMTNL